MRHQTAGGARQISRWRPLCIVLGLLVAPLFILPVTFGRPDGTVEYRSVVIEDIPHVRQKPDFCGEACAEMYLRKLGHAIDQDDIFDQSLLDPALGRGCYTHDLTQALQRVGFRIGQVWYTVPTERSDEGVEAQFRALHEDLLIGVPSIICMRYDDRPRSTEHFRLIVGYDAESDEVFYHEPAEDRGKYRRMSRLMLTKLWPLKYDTRRWTIIRMPLRGVEPRFGGAASVPEDGEFTNADYAQHIMQLKRNLPHRDFHIVLQEPFVVIGDEPAETVERRSIRTIKWAVDRIKHAYFSKDPARIVDIWLFKDKESYEQHTLKLFGTRPTTPFGYYSPTHDALVMNISTGGGTLVHELVHPFIESNFAECPAWFNEGLASLYEQCGDREGRIWGYTNWRLAGLQQAIGRGAVPPFQTLCEMTTRQFYDEDAGTNYAQARYLCYYLQEKQLLTEYYHRFRRSVERDPFGFQTLQSILDEEDMVAFQKRWEAYVLKLKFR